MNGSSDAAFAKAAVLRLSLIEFWERYSFFTTFALLALFAAAPVVRGGLGWDAAQALQFFGAYLLAVQLTPIAGGWLADRVIGMGPSLRLGAVALMLGHSLLAITAALPWMAIDGGDRLLDVVAAAGKSFVSFDAQGFEGAAGRRYGLMSVCFYLAVALIAIGNGMFKPILTVVVGRLPHPDEAARTAAFTTFFLNINIGGLMSMLLGGWLAERYGWSWAFAGSAIGMIVAIATMLVLDRKYLRPFVVAPRARAVESDLTPGSSRERGDHRWIVSIACLLVLLVICSIFSFQSYGFVSLFTAEFVAREIGGFTIPPVWFTALNPITIMVLTPLLLRLWQAGGPGSTWSTAQQFAAALMLMALGFLPLVAAAAIAVDGVLASPLWVAVTIVLIAASELLYAPAAMAASTRLAPAKLATLVIGCQGAAIGFGAWLSGQVGALAFKGDKALVMGVIAAAAGLTAAVLVRSRRRFSQIGL
jgi:POT family proton-dependent oligopeptide transporter